MSPYRANAQMQYDVSALKAKYGAKLQEFNRNVPHIVAKFEFANGDTISMRFDGDPIPESELEPDGVLICTNYDNPYICDGLQKLKKFLRDAYKDGYLGYGWVTEPSFYPWSQLSVVRVVEQTDNPLRFYFVVR